MMTDYKKDILTALEDGTERSVDFKTFATHKSEHQDNE